MADQIRATPRSPLFGLFSDIVNVPLDYMSDPRRTQQMQGVASFIRGTGVPSTLQNLAYDPSGRGLFTGAGGLGGTTRLRPEVIEAALTVAPGVGPAARMTKGLPVGMSIKDVSYRGSHVPPNAKTYGATLDDLGKIMPLDVYSSKGKNLYGIGDNQIDAEWYKAAYLSKGNPDRLVDVYRAVPRGVKDINEGDWVTTSKTYAKNHGENALGGDYDIVSMKVKANTLSSEGYPYEFGYNSNSLPAPPTSPMYADPFGNTITDTTR